MFRDLPELGTAVAGWAQRDDVVEVVRVRFRPVVGPVEETDRDDVVDVRVPSDGLGRRTTDHALVVVAFECLPAHAVPPRPVVVGSSAKPIGVTLAGEFLRESLREAVPVAQGSLSSHVTRVAFDGITTGCAFEFDLPTSPPWVVGTPDVGVVTPGPRFDTLRTVQTLFF